MPYLHLLLPLIFLLTTISSGYASQYKPTIVLSTFAGPPLSNNNRTGLYDRIIIEAFDRIGEEISIVNLPAERSLANANSGITDGDFVRISGLSKLYPNLIQVDEKIADFEFVAFTKKNIQVENWESCKPYHIGVVRGWKILETNLVGCASLTKVKNQDLLFTLLQKDRVDIIVYSRFEGHEIIKEKGLTNIKPLSPPLAVREMFLYLNKKHIIIIPALTNALKDMKMDGTYMQIYDQTLNMPRNK